MNIIRWHVSYVASKPWALQNPCQTSLAFGQLRKFSRDTVTVTATCEGEHDDEPKAYDG
jgi:hypothetical protein